MSIERLQRAVSEKLASLGAQAKEKLALEAGVSVSTIRNVEAGQAPRRGTAYKLAVACGLAEKEALKIATRCASERARETA
jgi:transcriptional regulator with XRE-family HTH domain